MDREQKLHVYSHEAQVLPPFISHQVITPQAPSPVSNNGFPVLAIAVIGVTATLFLLVSYYILATKCCFTWQQLGPLRRFSFRQARQNQYPLMPYSPNSLLQQHRGLDEMHIREIPTFQYNRTEGQNSSPLECVVCLTEFQDQDMLRLLPRCSHAFHLDCIDIWLQSNANCPLCRTSILGTTRDPFDIIIAPNSSPQDLQPFIRSPAGSDEDFVVIEMSGTGEEGTRRLLQRQQDRINSSRNLVQPRSQSSRKSDQKLGNLKSRKFHRVSIMGDECINVRQKDDQFSIEPIRRSFSMDSAADRHVYLSVQEVIRQSRHLNEARNNEECSSRSQRSIFSFGHGRGSKRAVLSIDHLY